MRIKLLLDPSRQLSTCAKIAPGFDFTLDLAPRAFNYQRATCQLIDPRPQPLKASCAIISVICRCFHYAHSTIGDTGVPERRMTTSEVSLNKLDQIIEA